MGGSESTRFLVSWGFLLSNKSLFLGKNFPWIVKSKRLDKVKLPTSTGVLSISSFFSFSYVGLLFKSWSSTSDSARDWFLEDRLEPRVDSCAELCDELCAELCVELCVEFCADVDVKMFLFCGLR